MTVPNLKISRMVAELAIPRASAVVAGDATERPASFADFDRRARSGEALSVVFFGGSLRGQREEVLRYVAQDVRTTMEMATACEALREFRWIARSGKWRSMTLPGDG